MSETSPRLALPLIAPSQAQKHVTHNEAVVLLDGLVQMTLLGVEASDPPAAGTDGDAWGLGPSPTGLWEGRGGEVAIRSNGGWVFAAPAEGWRAWDLSSGAPLRHDGSAWRPDLPALANLDGLGIGTGYDAANRLSVASDAVLLSHAGAGMQLKVNKAAASDTGSLLFQTGWSGRAEMGLAGSDAFEVKVSADGAAWTTGLRVAGGGPLEAPMGLSVGGGAPLASCDVGAWTPMLASDAPAAGAQQSGSGTWARLGGLVHVEGVVALADPGTGGGGDLRIEGLPVPGTGLAAASAEPAGFAWAAGERLLEADGAVLRCGPQGARLGWSALAAGSTLRLSAVYRAA